MQSSKKIKVSSLVARAWSVHSNSWKGCQYAYGERIFSTGRAVRPLPLLGRPANSWIIAPTRVQAADCCNPRYINSAASNAAAKRVRQGILYQDDRRWWAERHQTRNSRLPDARHKDSRKAPWLDNCYRRPAWVGAQLGTLDAQMDRSASGAPCSLPWDYADHLVGGGVETRWKPDSIIKELCQQGQVKGAVEVLELLGPDSGIDKYAFYSVLKESVVKKDLKLGCQVHALAVKLGFGSDTFLCNHLIRMYAGHGKLQEAMDVFEGVALPDTYMWSSIVSAHVKHGQPERAIELYQHMRATSMKPSGYVLVAALQACVAAGDLQVGKQLHVDVSTSGMEHDLFVCSCLVDMYAKCGSLKDARRVFDSLGVKDVVTWNAMIAGYARVEGMGHEALGLYSAMLNEATVSPNAVTFVCLLQACANVGMPALEKGKQLHSQLQDRRLESDVVVGGSLVNMYAKCGSLRDARTVFERLGRKNVVTWNAMISGYAHQDGMGEEAVSLFTAMRYEGMSVPDAVTYVCLLEACANMGVSALETGKQFHSQLRGRGLESDVVVGASLVNMYAKCGSLKDARIVFDTLSEKNVVTWTVMISGYAQQEGMGQEALDLYRAMHNEDTAAPNAVTLVCLLQACANVGVSALDQGKQFHSQLMNQSLESDVGVGGSLVNMYVKCGSLSDARIMFDGLREKNVVTWTSMIAGYAQQESLSQEALSLYSAMHHEGMAAPDAVTFVCLLQACANVGESALEIGKQLHSQLKDRRLESDLVVGGSLINMYAKCGSLKDAQAVFDRLSEKNVVTWTAMISGYAQQEGMGHKALDLYGAMHNEGMVAPDAVTFVCLLQACANVGSSALETGKQLHSELKDRGLESDVVVGGGLVNMYVNCGSLPDARIVFDELGEKNVVTWNAMISGYSQQESMCQEALNIYTAMRNEGMVKPDAVTYVCLLDACASVGALQQGKQLHSEIRIGGFESNVFIGTSLLKLYAKCGCLKVSREVFDRLPVKDLVIWNALLKAYAEHGEGGSAVQCFEELLEEGIRPDTVTYTCLFTACSHAGLVDQAQQYFETMKEQHGVEGNDWHYNCMVDLFGRSGHLDRAELLLRASGLAGSTVSWTALLTACKSYGDAETGRRCFEHLVRLDPTDASAYVLLAGIYANEGRWDEVDKVELLRKAAGAIKMAAKASIEVKRVVHEFTVGEERSDVAATLRKMYIKVQEGGHVPQTQLILKAVSEQAKEDALCGHAEKLALAYGLLHTPASSTLVVTKNLRMCDDCHSSTKIMSQLEKREIVVRDGHKVHRFQNGACSCQDRP